MNGYISSDCGTGKSHQMSREVCLTFTTVKHLIVQQTIKLQNETMQKTGLHLLDGVKLINCETTTSNLLGSIKSALADPETRVILITEQMFYCIEPELLKDVKVWMDDCVQFSGADFRGIALDDYDYLSKIYEHSIFDVIGNYNQTYWEIRLKDIVPTMSDDVCSIISSLKSKTVGYNRLVVNKDFINNPPVGNQRRYVNFVYWHDLSVYTNFNVVFMSNNFENTLLYKSNKNTFEEIEFNGRDNIDRSRLDVKYFVPSTALKYGMTKSFINTEEGSSAMNKMITYVNQKEEQFYFTTNVDKDEIGILTGNSYSPNLRGINGLQEMKTCAWLSCMNGSTQEIKVFNDVFGFNGLDIKIERELEVMYQFVCRGIVRDRSCSDTMVVYVVSEDQARFLVDNPTYVDLGFVASEVDKGGRPTGKTLSKDDQNKWDAFKKYCKRNNDYTGFEEFSSHFNEVEKDFIEKQWGKFIDKNGSEIIIK